MEEYRPEGYREVREDRAGEAGYLRWRELEKIEINFAAMRNILQ